MKSKHWACALALACLPMPSHAQPSPGDVESVIETGTSIYEDIVDIYRTFEPLPPVQTIPYHETQEFDRQLYSSLHTELPVVTAHMNTPFVTTAIPTRMANWMRRIQKKHGSIVNCQARTQGSVADVITIVGAALRGIRNWRMYRSATSYNVQLMSDPADSARIVDVRFVLRPGGASCGDGYNTVPFEGEIPEARR